MLLITLLAVVELGSNFWLHYFYHCDFEDSEIFKEVDTETIRKLCLESVGGEFIEEASTDAIDHGNSTIITKGFRNQAFYAEKPENTIRIFAIGGSTTFGHGAPPNQSYPFKLQKNYDNSNLDFKVEVINAGWPSRWSLEEYLLIKDILIDYEPDLFLVYDGVNEIGHQTKPQFPMATPDLWFERWKEICSLGKINGFDTIVTLQPSAATGNKILTIEEKKYLDRYMKYNPVGQRWAELYPLYIEKLGELKNHCSLTVDLRGLYDNIEEPIYYDFAHTGPIGNKIIADKFFELSLPFVLEKSKQIDYPKVDNDSLTNIDTFATSNYLDSFFEETSDFLTEIISWYKTPKVMDLVFNSSE